MWSKRRHPLRKTGSEVQNNQPPAALNLTVVEAFNRHRRLYALLLALAAGALTWVAGSDEPTPQTSVIVAARQLPVGTELSASDLKELSLPASVVAELDGLFTDDAELIGRKLLVPLTPEAPLTRSSLLDSALLDSVPEGMQAVTIRPQDPIGTQLIPSGTSVEVFEAESFEDGTTEPTVLSAHALVLHNAGFQREAKAGGWPRLGADPEETATIVVAVPQERARAVVAAAARGRVLLALSSQPTPAGTAAD